MDPDEYLRAHGPAAFQRVLDNALGLAEMGWRCALKNRDTLQWKDITKPEVRGQIEQQLFDLTATMQDATMRRHFEVFYRDKLVKHFGTCRPISSERITVMPPNLARKPRGAAASKLASRSYGKLVELTPLLAAGAAQRRIEEQPVAIEHPLRKEPAA